MKKQKLSRYEKGLILTGIVVLIIFLIIITADGINNMGKNKQNLALLEQEITVPPNVPVLSAGMIPVKYEGDNLIIAENGSNWYNYEEGKPAYIMLNDGVYQSELVADMTNKKLASENVEQEVLPEEQGSIYMWIPRFETNEENQIKYVQNAEYAKNGYKIPNMFTHKQAAETSPDFLLTGVWVEKTPLANANAVTTKVANMTGENNTYGFIANTMAVSMTAEDKTAIEEYSADIVGVDAHIDPITDSSNTNRTIIHIINPQYRDLIKAKSNYSKSTGMITVQVTYSEYEINTIKLEDKELAVEKNNNITTANTQGIILEDGIYTITIIDDKGNEKKLETQVSAGIYAALYTDGTLAFGKNNPPIPETEKAVSVSYGDISDLTDRDYIDNGKPWEKEIADITTVEFVKEIMPRSTYRWFEGCTNLTEIKNTENLDTKNVTDMSNMFYGCSSLTSLDLSNFDTRKVTDMKDIFYGCSNLTEIAFGENWEGTVTLPTFEKTYSGWYDKSNDNLLVSKGNKETLTYTPTGAITIYADVTQPIYVKFYTDGTLAFNSNNTKMEGKTVQKDYGDISEETDWYPTFSVSSITKAIFLDEITPTSTAYWFFACKNLTEIENIENLNTAKVTTMSNMFYGCSSLTSLDLSGFDTKNVTTMREMFSECTSLTSLDLSSFDTRKVTDMNNIFYVYADYGNLVEIIFGENWKGTVTLPEFRKTCSGWYDKESGSKVANTNATYTPTGAITIYADVALPIYAKTYDSGKLLVLSSKDVNYQGKTPTRNYKDISENLTKFQSNTITKVVILDKIIPILTDSWFDNCYNLTEIENIENIDTSRVTNMNYMFYKCKGLTSLDLSSFNTKNVTNMQSMFEGCSNLSSIDLSSFDTRNVTKMDYMFSECSSLTSLDLSSFNTKNVKYMGYMFYDCRNLTTIYVGANWSLASSRGSMFTDCGTSTTTRK